MQVYASTPIPPALPFLKPFAYLDGATWTYGNGTAAGAVAYINDTVGTAMPIAVDNEMAGFNEHADYLRLLGDVRRITGTTRKLIGSVIDPNPNREATIADARGYTAHCRDVAKSASWLKVGVYALGSTTWDRDMAYARTVIAAAKTTGRTVVAEVCDRFEAWLDDAGTAHYDFRDPMTPEQVYAYAGVVKNARASAAAVFAPTVMSVMFAYP